MPNVVLIMTDQMRGDCMGTAGHPDVKTPYLDSLAARGVLFTNAYTACPSCVPARAALHTGLTQKSHGRVGYEDRVDWNYDCTMAGELAKAGLYTQCVGKMHVHPLRNLMGFHNIELHDGYLHNYRYPGVAYGENQKVADDYFFWLKNEKGIECDVTDTGIECNSWVARPWIYEEKYHPTNWATSRSIDFLRRRDPRKPFFLMTSYVRPHAPFDAPQAYFDMYEHKNLRPPVEGDWDDCDTIRSPRGRIFDSDTGPADPELIRQEQVGYYACITHIDHQIGRLIQALVEYQLYQDTLIIFTSDHGEMLSDHHIYRKSRPYQGSVRIPMIVSGPKALLGRQGVTCDALAELRDVMPTLLDAAGAPIPASVEGRSLLPAARGMEDSREYLHGEHSYAAYSNHYIVTKQDKFVWYSQTGREEYFCLANDPDEKHNAIRDEDCAGRVDMLRGLLIRELAGREEGYSDGERLVVGCQPKSCLSHIL